MNCYNSSLQSTRSSTPTPHTKPAPQMDISMYFGDDEGESEDPDYIPTTTQTSFDFSKEDVNRIQNCIQEICSKRHPFPCKYRKIRPCSGLGNFTASKGL